MAGKEFPDLIFEGKPTITLEQSFTKLTRRDQTLFNNGNFFLALNSSFCGLIANSSFRRVLNVTQVGFASTSSMFLLPFITTAVTYEILVKQPLLAALLCWIVSGKRRPGRQRTRWLDTIKADTRLSLRQLSEVAQDRKIWKELAHRIAKSQIQLNG